jgi:hypothetical protein
MRPSSFTGTCSGTSAPSRLTTSSIVLPLFASVTAASRAAGPVPSSACPFARMNSSPCFTPAVAALSIICDVARTVTGSSGPTATNNPTYSTVAAT